MLLQDRLELSDRHPINTPPVCSCGSTQRVTPLARESGRAFSSLATALVVALLPKCPMCLLAYAGILGSLGLGSRVTTTLYLTWMPPVSILFLGMTIVALAFRAHLRRGYGPAIMATIAGAAILLGKFQLDWLPMIYIGLLLMFIAVTWNTWPKKDTGNCY